MPEKMSSAVAVVGIDIGKNSFHVVGLNARGEIVLRQKFSRLQIERRFANMPPCLVGMEACVGAHHLSRRLKALGHNARLMPASSKVSPPTGYTSTSGSISCRARSMPSD
jgi:transposase